MCTCVWYVVWYDECAYTCTFFSGRHSTDFWGNVTEDDADIKKSVFLNLNWKLTIHDRMGILWLNADLLCTNEDSFSELQSESWLHRWFLFHPKCLFIARNLLLSWSLLWWNTWLLQDQQSSRWLKVWRKQKQGQKKIHTLWLCKGYPWLSQCCVSQLFPVVLRYWWQVCRSASILSLMCFNKMPHVILVQLSPINMPVSWRIPPM